MGGFNNFNSTIGSQTIGNTYINNGGRDVQINEIQKHLDAILVRVNTLDETGASKADVGRVLTAVAEMKMELGSAKPRVAVLERSLAVIGNVASVVSLVDQIRPFLRGIL